MADNPSARGPTRVCYPSPPSAARTMSSRNLRRLSETYVYIGFWRSAQVATFADRLKAGLTQVSANAAGRDRPHGCERRQVGRAAGERERLRGLRAPAGRAHGRGEGAVTWAASVGKSRAAARRRREQRRSSSANDDDGGGFQARLREQQAQTNECGPLQV